MEAETRIRLPRKVASLKKVAENEIESSAPEAENEEGSDDDPDAGAEGADYGNDSDSYNQQEGAKSAKTGVDEPDLAEELGEDAEEEAPADFNEEVSFGESGQDNSAETDEEQESSQDLKGKKAKADLPGDDKFDAVKDPAKKAKGDDKQPEA